MDQNVVILIVAILILLGTGIAVVLNRRPRLRPLPAESVERFSRSWQAVESRFIDDPRAAVQEADRVVVMMLTERGATMHDERHVPDDLRSARAAAASDEGRQGTEGLRKAMLHYKRIVVAAVGSPKKEKETSRREVA
ncbi:MAG: hypothetical protein E6I29_00785 [Chloroflexi bacterium]|nr:MAG: hypothetical protein E6I41_08925 [Chloroflexota bacterium]TMF33152.1 MAG: hypothetical protein E6I29_00785 [Chloroflexota bacterium]TMF52962.1 MAG: hypothetical protein E6I21_03420 [Chloroflexota bacterium]